MSSREATGSSLERLADEEIVARYADGDAEAFDELFRRYEARAYGFFLKRTRSPERAEDLYQELFLRVHRARAAFDPERRFAPWFFQIADRLLVDDLRRSQRGHEVAIEERDLCADPAAGDGEERVATREHLRRVLDGLSFEERYILVGAKLEGIAYAELARRLGKSADAVKKAASRAMQRLRAAAEAQAMATHSG